MVLLILFTLLQCIIAGLFVYLCIAFITGGPYVPSRKKSVDSMIRIARLTNKSVIYDLGSGDGRVLFAAAKIGARAVGIEMNPYLVLWTTIQKFFMPDKKNITVLWKNLWTANLHDADVVFVYLIPWRMETLAVKLKKELKPGSLVISNSFIFPTWTILRSDEKNHIYVFQV
jgi:hypothetical protein